MYMVLLSVAHACDPGQYTVDDGSCHWCPAGNWCPTGQYRSIYLCDIGTYSPGSLSACLPCPLGFYMNMPGASACFSCPPRTTTLSPQSTSFTDCCPAGSWGQDGMKYCILCPPGTYSYDGSPVCSPCPLGTFGSSSGLTTSACSGSCSPVSACPLGTAFPPQAPPVLPETSLSCTTSGVRAAPASLGLLLWPAAHPANVQKVDLIIAPLDQCKRLLSASEAVCAAAGSVTGKDGTLRYVVGTAAALHLEAAESLMCAAQDPPSVSPSALSRSPSPSPSSKTSASSSSSATATATSTQTLPHSPCTSGSASEYVSASCGSSLKNAGFSFSDSRAALGYHNAQGLFDAGFTSIDLYFGVGFTYQDLTTNGQPSWGGGHPFGSNSLCDFHNFIWLWGSCNDATAKEGWQTQVFQ